MIEPVGIFVGVEGCLNVASAHDYLDKDLYHGCGSHCARKPSCPVLVGRCRELGGASVGGTMTEQGAVGVIPAGCVVAASIFDIIVDVANEGVGISVKGRKSGGADRAYRDAVIVMSFDRIERHGFKFKVPLRPLGEVEGFAPAPLIMTHRAVKLGGLAVGKAVMVGGIELAPAVVVLDKVAAKTEYILEVLEHLEAAAIGGRRGGGEVCAPYTTAPRGVCHIDSRCQVHTLAGSAFGVENLYLLVGGIGGRCREVVYLLAGFVCVEHDE